MNIHTLLGRNTKMFTTFISVCSFVDVLHFSHTLIFGLNKKLEGWVIFRYLTISRCYSLVRNMQIIEIHEDKTYDIA